MSNKTKFALAVAVVALAAVSRLVKHPFNFTPVAAMSIFAGYYLKNRWGALLPLAAMLLSDLFIGFYDWQVMAAVYLSIMLAFFIGKYASGKKWFYVPISALASSVLFFLVTNFAVWAFFDWYPHTIAGLAANFTLALPFFRNTLLGDVFYTGVLFGAYEAVLYMAAKKSVKEATV